MDVPVASDLLAFDDWRFDQRTKVLLRRDAYGSWEEVAMGPRAREVLALLLEQPGALVPKDEIMNAVWSRVVVESNNLNVQIAAIRKTLDVGRATGSYIQTVPGRGYRFAVPVTGATEATSTLPRLSLAVLPFESLGGDTNDDYLADAVTEDLTTNLSRLPGALVIARTSADFYRGKSVDVRRVGQEFGVRYLVGGSTRRLGDTLRVNVQLVSTETAAHLWAERFDQDIEDLCVGQDEIANRLGAELGVQVVESRGHEVHGSVHMTPTRSTSFSVPGRHSGISRRNQSVCMSKRCNWILHQRGSRSCSLVS